MGRLASIVLFLFLGAWALDFRADTAERDCFSWMDPAQYHGYASALADEQTPGGGFDVASAFPIAVRIFLDGARTPASALLVNLAAALLLTVAVLSLHRALRIALPPALSVILVLTAPLLVGLSRELYVEFFLSALVALQLVLWWRTDRFRRSGMTILFGILFAVGLATKMTFLLFFAGPLIVEGIDALRRRQGKRLLRMVAAVAIPAGALAAVIALFLPESFRYYTSLGNTRIPIMKLIGPPHLLSIDSILYYPIQFGKTVFRIMTPLLIVPILVARRFAGGEDENRRAFLLTLLLLVVGAPLLLTFQVVKEPRHIAPIVGPAILLVVWGIDRLRGARARAALAVVAIALAVVPYLAATRGDLFLPYRLTGRLEPRNLERAMVDADANLARYRDAAGGVDVIRWRFTKSIALAGFDPNEALALTWHFAPAVVYDLDRSEGSGDGEEAYRSFEDLFFFTAFNAYNGRARWDHRYETLSPEDVLDLADYLIVRDGGGEETADRFPRHRSIGSLDAGGGITLFARDEPPASSYRERYAREYLSRNTPSETRELNTIYFELFLIERLRGVIPNRERLIEGFPDSFDPGADIRNIHWIGHDFPLQALGMRAYKEHLAGRL